MVSFLNPGPTGRNFLQFMTLFFYGLMFMRSEDFRLWKTNLTALNAGGRDDWRGGLNGRTDKNDAQHHVKTHAISLLSLWSSV